MRTGRGDASRKNTMEKQKVSITPKPMTLKQAVTLFESLDSVGRQEFYQSLGDDERDALYEQATDTLIARVHLTTKNRIDAQWQKKRNEQRGYLVPEECHRAENECMWRSAAWSILLGTDTDERLKNLPHMHPHFQALRDA